VFWARPRPSKAELRSAISVVVLVLLEVYLSFGDNQYNWYVSCCNFLWWVSCGQKN
jgi:hypothetical protein